MTTKRSYHEAEGGDGQRRSDPVLDQLNRSLVRLERQLGLRTQKDVDFGLPAPAPQLDVSQNRPQEKSTQTTLEDKIRALVAENIQLPRDDGHAALSASLLAIENRLEEISRAIVANSMIGAAHAADPTPFDRIEARLAKLSRLMAEADRPSDAVRDQLEALSTKVEQMSASSTISDLTVDKLARHIGLLTEKIASAMANQPEVNATQELENRLGLILQRLDETSRIAPAVNSMTNVVSQRLEKIARKLDEPAASPPLASSIDGALSDLQQRLNEISHKLDTPAQAPAAHALESQLSTISNLLVDVQTESASLAPRLDRIEADLGRGKDEMALLAREAAELALRSTAAPQNSAAAGFTEDLKALEALARNADDRNGRAFDDVHAALMRIVGRLDNMDNGAAATAKPVAQAQIREEIKAELASESAPVVETLYAPSQFEAPRFEEPAIVPDSETAVYDAEQPAVGDDVEYETARAEHSIDIAPEVPSPIQPEAIADTPEIERAFVPGAGAQDFNAILNRVRMNRSLLEQSDRADILAAARRAARAAADEAQAELAKDQSEAKGSRSLLDRLLARKKLILAGIAAVSAALIASQVSQSFFKDPLSLASFGKRADEAAQPVMQLAYPTRPQPSAAPVITATIPADAGPAALRAAASGGNVKALFELGARYAEGRSVKPNMAAAAKWYEQAANAGFAPAQYRLGTFYQSGAGVARNLDTAKAWYQRAAEQGNASAMHNLATLLASSSSNTVSEAAMNWFARAAELGVKDSQFNLGVMFGKGIGAKQDLEASYKWFALAARNGDADAANKRETIAAMLQPSQLANAQALVEAWKPRALNADANGVETPDNWRDGAVQTASTPAVVKDIQAKLRLAGYDAGLANGSMSDQTKQAIAQFQMANGMEPTATIDKRLVAALSVTK